MKLLLLLSFVFYSFSFQINPIIFRTEIGHCEIRGTENDPTIRGSALFVRIGNSIVMNLDVQGITVNTGMEHGVHLHQYGDISSPLGLSTSTHFNPQNKSHGCPSSLNRHIGDTGNWDVTSDGKIQGSKMLNLIRLTGPFSIIGRALIIHSGVDDCMNETSAGERIAQCVIGIANPNLTSTVRSGNNAMPGISTDKAVCVLQPTFGNEVSGMVLFEAEDNGTVTVKARVHNLSRNSIHGFHIHQFGDLRNPNGMATGEHWNPFHNRHSIPPLSPRHLGDMGNIYYYEGDTAYYMNNFDTFALKGNIKHAIGHAIIIHEGADDCSDPSGNSGQRLAQCVIGYANPTTTLSPLPGVPTAQDTRACKHSAT